MYKLSFQAYKNLSGLLVDYHMFGGYGMYKPQNFEPKFLRSTCVPQFMVNGSD